MVRPKKKKWCKRIKEQTKQYYHNQICDNIYPYISTEEDVCTSQYYVWMQWLNILHRYAHILVNMKISLPEENDRTYTKRIKT